MSDATNTTADTDATTNQTTNTPTFDIESINAELETLRAENAKLKQIKRGVTKERDELKNKVNNTDQSDENFRELYKQRDEAYNKLYGQLKQTAIDNAVRDQLTKLSIQPDTFDAALKLLDRNLIDWNEEDGVDLIGLDAATKKLKSSFGFLFEKKVTTTDPKTPASSKQNINSKEIPRSEFFKLPPNEQMKLAKAKYIITD